MDEERATHFLACACAMPDGEAMIVRDAQLRSSGHTMLEMVK